MRTVLLVITDGAQLCVVATGADDLDRGDRGGTGLDPSAHTPSPPGFGNGSRNLPTVPLASNRPLPIMLRNFTEEKLF